jgi:hypothetical protein
MKLITMQILVASFTSGPLGQMFFSAPCFQTPLTYFLPLGWENKIHALAKQQVNLYFSVLQFLCF